MPAGGLSTEPLKVSHFEQGFADFATEKKPSAHGSVSGATDPSEVGAGGVDASGTEAGGGLLPRAGGEGIARRDYGGPLFAVAFWPFWRKNPLKHHSRPESLLGLEWLGI